MLKQAIIYTRFSPRPNAKDCDSCYNQEMRCFKYCKQREYSAEGTYGDEGVTGGILNRPRLQAAIKALNPGDILIVDSSDRLARDMLVNLTIRQQVADVGATIEYANGSPSEDTPEGRLFQNMLAAFAAYERDRIRLRTKQGLDRKRGNGERTTGKIPIGWKKDPKDHKKLVRCELERAAILMACDCKIKGLKSQYIARELDKQCGPCRGKSWSARTIRRIIKREAFWACPETGDLSLEPTHP